MEESCSKNRRKIKNSNRRNIRNRLGYSPKVPKWRFNKDSRKVLKARRSELPSIAEQATRLKFGSFNVRGLDLETAWVIQSIIQHRGFDVSTKQCRINTKVENLGFST